MRPMRAVRILIITPSGRRLGGSEVMLGQFLVSAKAHGYDVHVVFLEAGEHFQETINSGHSCELVKAGRLRQPLQWLRAWVSIGRILKRFRPDIVIGWQSKAIAYAGVPSWRAGIPFYCFHRGNPGGGFVDRIGYAHPCDGYLANSSFTAAKLRAYTRRPIAVIHSAVDCTRFHPEKVSKSNELKARFGFDPGRPLIGIVGRLQRWKGIHIFLQAVEMQRNLHPNCQSVIVGGSHGLEPGYVEFLEKQLRADGPNGQTRMVGSQDNVHEWMQAMDVIVHASDQEPFGIVVIEAMSLGKPVIASVPGGPAEIIEDGVNGLLVRYGDAGALAGAIDHFLKNPEFAAACGSRAREAALKYDGANYAARVVEAVDSLRGA